MMASEPQNRAILIAALGGEGGGVLSGWIADTLRAAGFACQTTSIPGVAQRTGATTYYIEYCKIPERELGGRRIVFALTPVPNQVDVFIASELIEAARGAQSAYISPDRTTVIASAHRTYSIFEKMAMSDGRFDSARALKAVHGLSRRAILFDMQAVADGHKTAVNAVLLGAVAASGAIPIDAVYFKRAIEGGGKAAEDNLRGFEAGLRFASAGVEAIAAAPPSGQLDGETAAGRFEDFPVEVRFTVEHGYSRTLDYQDQRYADEFLDRARALLALDRTLGGANQGWRLTIEGARFLALRMTYEDVIRVADLKSRAERYAAVRKEVRAAPGQPVHITEYLKPGPEEACALLPRAAGNFFLAALRRRRLEHRFHLGLHIRSDTITGFLLLRLLARMRVLRRRSWRFVQEKGLTERWFAAVMKAAEINYQFGVAVAGTADLLKGYSGTYRRGLKNFNLIFDRIIEPAIEVKNDAASAVATAQKAALSDPEIELETQITAPAHQGGQGHDAQRILA